MGEVPWQEWVKFWDQNNGYHRGLGLSCSDGSRRVEVLLRGCLLAPLLEHLPSHLVALPLRGFKNPEPNTPSCLNYLSCPPTGVSHARGLTFPLPADELLAAVWCGLSRRSASPPRACLGFIEVLPALETPPDLSVSFVFIAVINLPRSL